MTTRNMFKKTDAPGDAARVPPHNADAEMGVLGAIINAAFRASSASVGTRTGAGMDPSPLAGEPHQRMRITSTSFHQNIDMKIAPLPAMLRCKSSR